MGVVLYLSSDRSCDLQEAVASVREMGGASVMSVMVREALNHVLEKTSESRHVTGKLFCKLLEEGVLDQTTFLEG